MLNLQMMAGPRVASPVSSPRSPHSAKHGELIRLAKGKRWCYRLCWHCCGAACLPSLGHHPFGCMPALCRCCGPRCDMLRGHIQLPPHPQHITSLRPPGSDLSELDLPQQVTLSFPHGMEHSQWFEVAMTPGEDQSVMPRCPACSSCAGACAAAAVCGGKATHASDRGSPCPALVALSIPAAAAAAMLCGAGTRHCCCCCISA